MAQGAVDYAKLAAQFGGAPQGKTDARIEVERPPVNQPSMSPAVRGTALPADLPVDPMFGTVMRNEPKGPVETALHTPLGQPTGVEAIDEQMTPANLILLGTQVVPRAARMALTKLHGLLQSAPEMSADILGLLSPRSAHALRVAQRVSDAVAKGQTLTSAEESALLKQGYSKATIGKIREQMAKSGPTSPAASATAAPTAEASTAPVAAAPPPPASVRTPAAPPPAAPAAAEMSGGPAAAPKTATVPIRPDDTLQLPLAARTKGQQSGAWLANDVGIAAKRVGVTLAPKDVQLAVEVVRQTGRSPLEVVQGLKATTGAAAPTKAAAAMQQLAAGLPTDDAMHAAVAARNATGRWPK